MQLPSASSKSVAAQTILIGSGWLTAWPSRVSRSSNSPSPGVVTRTRYAPRPLYVIDIAFVVDSSRRPFGPSRPPTSVTPKSRRSYGDGIEWVTGIRSTSHDWNGM